MRWGRLCAVTAVLLSGLAVAPSEAKAAPVPAVRTVRVSAVNEARQTFNYAAFYPRRQQAHRGDTVQWKFLDSYAGWHTVTFAPSDMDVAKHPTAAYPTEVGDAWGIEESGLLKLPDRLALGSPEGAFGPACGRGPITSLNLPGQPPCVLNGTDTWVGSSVSDAFFAMNNEDDKTFSVVVGPSMPTGTYRYHCLLHNGMVGELEVVDDDAPVAPYTDADYAREVAADTATAQALADRFADPTQAYDPETGEWTVHVTETTDDGRVSIMEYLPAAITVKPGDTVRYVAGGESTGTGEPNTVTFPAAVAGGFCIEGGPTSCWRARVVGIRPLGGTAFIWGCDPDDLNSGVPMVPITWTALRSCPPGQMLEWTIAPYMSHPQEAPGGEVSTPATYHNSGNMMPSTGPAALRNRGDGTQFPSSFTATFPREGTFTYKCLGHPDFMAGVVEVAS